MAFELNYDNMINLDAEAASDNERLNRLSTPGEVIGVAMHGTHFDDADALQSWEYGAEAWDHFVKSGADYYRYLVHGPALLEAAAPQPKQRVLDVGCGEGYFSREVAAHGASVVGIDLSPKLISYARAEEARQYAGIEYVVGSTNMLDEFFPENSFDLVIACMSLQDMSDPAACLRGVARVLRRTGRLVFSVPHPCSDTPFREWERDADGRKLALKTDRYFDTGAGVCNWNMARLKYPWATPHWRRTFEEWTSMTAAAGFVIRRLYEPRPDASQVAAHPELDDCARLPYFVIFDASSQ